MFSFVLGCMVGAVIPLITKTIKGVLDLHNAVAMVSEGNSMTNTAWILYDFVAIYTEQLLKRSLQRADKGLYKLKFIMCGKPYTLTVKPVSGPKSLGLTSEERGKMSVVLD